MDGLARIIRIYLSQIWQLRQHPVTSLVGLAGCILALWQLFGGSKNRLRDRPVEVPLQRIGGQNGQSAAKQAHTQAPAVRRPALLSGVKQLTISAPGVLLQERLPSELEESATLKQGVAPLLQQLCSSVGVVVLAQVDSDIGEATVRGALEAADLIGNAQNQLRPHRLLFCSTPTGKMSIVRQLNPELHIDSSQQTVFDLQRFVRRLVHVTPGLEHASQSLAQNVDLVPELSFAMGD